MNRWCALIAALFIFLSVGQAAAEAQALPKPGLVIEWRQSIEGAGRAAVRQEIVSVAGSVVSYRESTPANGLPANEFETWRGLVLIKRRIPQSAAYTESTLSYTLDLPALEALLPLAHGRRARIEVKGRAASRLGLTPTAPFRTSDLAGALTIVVERREAVSVPAGRFDTVVIRHEVAIEEVGMDNRTTIAARIWFAPALGWPVKKQQFDAKNAVQAEAVATLIKLP
jgi:hypothetical protein